MANLSLSPQFRARLGGLCLVVSVVAGVAFRLWDIASVPLWLDEAYSTYAAGKGFAFLWQVVPRYETHPPFYYSLLRLWSLLWGDGLTSVRALGVACGLLTIPVVAIAAREAGKWLGLDRWTLNALGGVAMMLIALAPMPIEMSRQVRPYPVMILVYSVAIVFLLRIGRRAATGERLDGWDYRAYLVALALMLWLHNLGALFAGALSLAMLALCARKGWMRRELAALCIGHGLVLIAWLPALVILADQAPTWMHSTWLRFPPADFGERAMTLFGVFRPFGGVAVIALTALAVLDLSGDAPGRRLLAALLALALAPLLVSVAVSATVTPVFIPRTLTPIGVPALLLFAIGAVRAKGWSIGVSTVALIVILVEMGSIDLNTRRHGGHERWYGVVRWIQARIGPGDIVLTYPNEGSLPFDRAVRDLGAKIPSRPIPTAVPSIGVGGWYPTGSRGVVSLPRQRLRAIVESPAMAKAPTVWLIRMGPWAYDRGDVFLHEFSRKREHVAHHQTGVIVLDGFRQGDGKQ